ncbi:MAG: hypothetical protein OEL83_02800 [Desulforhopalus sp.]|nr:hypothetical protein [Desulforhopalus sp.]
MKKLLVLIGLALLAYTFQGNITEVWHSLSPDGKPSTTVETLPAELRTTLDLVKKGGPYPFSRDGVVFENRERLLPEMSRGYYREYTVPTPGANNRGARRLVSGGKPPEVFYYTADHYRSFTKLSTE